MNKKIINTIKNTEKIIESWLPLKIKYDNIPGLSVGITHNGKLIYENHFGYSDLKKKIKPNKNTLYHIASISKTFTTASIMQLVKKNIISLDDKVSKYINWFSVKNKNKDSKNITIRQILSHSSGLVRDGSELDWNNGKFSSNLEDTFDKNSIIFENCTHFKYSNFGFSLLGEVIEKVTNLTYKEYIEKNILKPLGMNKTLVDYSSDVENLAIGYERKIPEQIRKSFNHYQTGVYAPAAGLISNLNDLAKYTKLFCKNAPVNILGEEERKKMVKPHEKAWGNEYGLGLEIINHRDRKLVGHSGGFNGFLTKFLIDRDSGIGVIVLSNSHSNSTYSITENILKIIIDGLEDNIKYSPNVNYRKYEGIYRDVWCDSSIVQFGKDLIIFSPDTVNPIKFSTILNPTKENHIFQRSEKDIFSMEGEYVTFSKRKEGKMCVMFCNSTSSSRIEL